jgi:hypothetical protein
MSDHTWTLFVRLWKRIATNVHHEQMWSDDTIRDLLAKHPLPWHTDQDWTWEILDEHDRYVTGGFRHEIDANEYIMKAQAVAARDLVDPPQPPAEWVTCTKCSYRVDWCRCWYKPAARDLAPEVKRLTDDQLRTLYARYCECRPLNTARCRHSHDCYCDVLTDVTVVLHGIRQELYGGELCDAEAVTDESRAAARERLKQAWRAYEEENRHLGTAPRGPDRV